MQTSSDTKMNPSLLFERGVDYFNHGDYAAARRDFKLLLTMNPSHDLEKRSREMLGKIGFDPIEILAGLGVLALLILLFVYFGLVQR